MKTPKRAPAKPRKAGRGQTTLLAVARDLPRLLADPPPWAGKRALDALARAAALLEADVAAVVGRQADRPAAAELGVSRSRLTELRAEGWLAGKWHADRAG